MRQIILGNNEASGNLVKYREHSVLKFGHEQEPIIVIDGFCGDLQLLLTQGHGAQYVSVNGYPGVRAPADISYLSPHGEYLADLLYDNFGFSVGFRSESCDFSIVTLAPDQLCPSQRIPHYDDTSSDLLALLHYTSGPETGGTAFYRHRRTGFETVRPERQKTYRLALRADDQVYGPCPPAYYYGDTERYDLIGEVEARPDRMAIYRGRMLHSGIIPNTLPLIGDPRRGRLTVNTFARGLK